MQDTCLHLLMLPATSHDLVWSADSFGREQQGDGTTNCDDGFGVKHGSWGRLLSRSPLEQLHEDLFVRILFLRSSCP